MNKITIFYSRRLGIIKEIVSGEYSHDWFGDEAEDYQTIYDILIVEDDNFIWQNYNDMIVEKGELKIQKSVIPNKYL